ncbi:MAG: MerR family transcriptional regulator [Verrucomicrobiota bacterium]
MSETIEEEQFQIGTVARLTGLTVYCIRAWENRYKVVEPRRSEANRRFYVRSDIRRLTLLKTLVDAGHSIGTIASLGIEQLEERLRNDHSGANEWTEDASVEVLRVLVVGSAVKSLFSSHSGQLEDFELVGEYENIEETASVEKEMGADIVIVSCPTVFPETVSRVQELAERVSARRVILVYGFAQAITVNSLHRRPGITAIRGPVNADELRLACLADIHLSKSTSEEHVQVVPEGVGIPNRKYSDEQLAKVIKISSSIQCECPQHLASLLFSLTAFETYSAECENRNAEDAQLHAYLHESTAKSRVTIEEALGRVIEAEGIKI